MSKYDDDTSLILHIFISFSIVEWLKVSEKQMTAHNYHLRWGAKAVYTNLFLIAMALQCIQLYIYFMLCIVLVSENKISKSLNFGCLVLVKCDLRIKFILL